jgi:hypothetical protein
VKKRAVGENAENLVEENAEQKGEALVVDLRD